jgi:hypothetical protein
MLGEGGTGPRDVLPVLQVDQASDVDVGVDIGGVTARASPPGCPGGMLIRIRLVTPQVRR